MCVPARPPGPLRCGIKLVVLGLLIVPGMLIESLDARAAYELPDKPVTIGRVYQLTTQTQLTGDCSGCDDHRMDPIGHAYIDVELTPDDAPKTVTFTIAGNSVFVAPVSGRLRSLRFNKQILPGDIAEQAAKYDCSNIDGHVVLFEVSEIDR